MQNSTLRTMRVLGALAVLAVGAVHLQQYAGDGYDSVPTIGPLFLLNGIASGIVGIALLLPVERWLTSRRADGTIGVLAMAGMGIAAGALVALFISETSSLFGFSEKGYRAAIIVAIAAEIVTLLLLAPVAVNSLRRFYADRRRVSSSERWPVPS